MTVLQRFLIVASIASFAIGLRHALAQEHFQAGGKEQAEFSSEQYIYLSRPFTAPFEPVRTLFFISTPSGTIQKYAGVIVAYERSGGGGTVSGMAGTRVMASALGPDANISVLLFSDGEDSFLLEPQEYERTQSDALTQSVDGLRAFLLNRKDVLKSWELQVRTQEESLDRLRADADIIANLARIVEVKEEAERFRQEARALEKDIANLRRLFAFTKGHSSPKNFVGRESQLQKQLIELNQILKDVGAGQVPQRTQRELDVQRKLALIEQTRFEDYEGLQRELIRLRKQKLNLAGGPT